MNHGQSNSSMATTRTENTHGLTYPVARAIDITAWQSVDTICLCCPTHGVCVSHWTPPSPHNSAMEMARVLSSVHAISMTSVQRVLDQPVCSMLVYYSQAWLTVPVYACVFPFFVFTHRSTVLSIIISNLNNKYNSLTLAPNMPCMLLVLYYIILRGTIFPLPGV